MGFLTVAVVDDHPIFRQGLVSVFANNMKFKAVYEGSCANDAVALAIKHGPDLLILDMEMPGGGMNALKEITQVAPEVRCVMLTVCDSADTAIQALNEGARGYILKGVGAAELVSAIETIMAEGTFVSPTFAARLLQAAQTPHREKALSNSLSILTSREIQVLKALETGLTNREIAESLAISEKTVKQYMTNIMQKFGVTNRVAAVFEFQKIRGSETHQAGVNRQ
jgi:two-component system, NarL family, nitrate/nitrite response regulator NarL